MHFIELSNRHDCCSLFAEIYWSVLCCKTPNLQARKNAVQANGRVSSFHQLNLEKVLECPLWHRSSGLSNYWDVNYGTDYFFQNRFVNYLLILLPRSVAVFCKIRALWPNVATAFASMCSLIRYHTFSNICLVIVCILSSGRRGNARHAICLRLYEICEKIQCMILLLHVSKK